jgi:Ca-activated chloride channel homolog
MMAKSCVATLSFTLLMAAFPAPSQSQSAATSGGPQVIRSEADLVILPVSVTDGHGHSVSGLKQQDFQVYEDGKPQAISVFMDNDAPVTVGLLVDCSGSMKENRSKVVEAAKDFLQFSNPQDQIFVVDFNQTPELGLSPDTPFTSSVSELQAAVESWPSEGMTALYDAIDMGLKHLTLGTNRRKALIIISDGGDDASELNLKKTLAEVQKSSTIAYTIGIVASDQLNVNPGVMRRLAEVTGGESYFPRYADQLPGISQQIARDLRAQYTIAFLPAAANGNSYRKIRVAVKAPGRHGLHVRTRPGYLASSPSKTTQPNS